MRKHILFSCVCVMFFFPSLSNAFLGFSNTVVQLSYACLGLDGVPITDATLSSQCCTGNHLVVNPPASCATSMYAAGTSEATSGTAVGINAANSAIDAANALSGAATGYAGASPTPSSGTTAVSSVSAASTAGTNPGSPSGSDPGDLGTTSFGNANSGNGNAGSAGGGSDSGDAIGTTSTGNPNSAVAAVVPGEGADGGAYTINSGGGSGAANGKNKAGSGIGGLFGSLFGGGAGGAKNAGSGMQDVNFGNGSGDGSNGMGLNGKNPDDGTTTDPADYFSRIDQSASLFKVVSNRYSKESERNHLELGIAKITQ